MASCSLESETLNNFQSKSYYDFAVQKRAKHSAKRDIRSKAVETPCCFVVQTLASRASAVGLTMPGSKIRHPVSISVSRVSGIGKNNNSALKPS